MGQGVQPLISSQGVHPPVNPVFDHTQRQKPSQFESSSSQPYVPGKGPSGSVILPSSNGVEQLGNLMGPLNLHVRRNEGVHSFMEVV